MTKQDRHSAYNVTLRHIYATIVAVDTQSVTYCGCVFVDLFIIESACFFFFINNLLTACPITIGNTTCFF